MTRRNGQSVARELAAALEDLAPRAAAPRPRHEQRTTCARCAGRVMRATDEDGERDDHCVACGWRVGDLTTEQATALRREIDARERGPGNKRTRRGRQANGVQL